MLQSQWQLSSSDLAPREPHNADQHLVEARSTNSDLVWLCQVEEQKRRAEADKLAAITALEVRSREFMVEKEEKRRLEARITSMQSQLLIGGHKIEDMPVFR